MRSVLDLLVHHKRIECISPLEARCVDEQRLDRTSRLPVALIGAVERIGRVFLASSADDRHNIARAIVNTHSSPLQIIDSLIRRIRKIGKCRVDGILKLLLYIHINGRIYRISARVQFLLAVRI